MAKSTAWHPEDIKAAVRKQGISLAQLSLDNGLSESACRQSLLRPVPSADRAIADFINVQLHKLWPDRYDAKGRRLIRPSVSSKQNTTAKKRRSHCEILGAQ